jgi:hypothetical protein
VPPGFAAAVVDGVRHELVRRDLASEDRQAVVLATRVPLGAREVWLER